MENERTSVTFSDMSALIARVREFIDSVGDAAQYYRAADDPAELSERYGFIEHGRGETQVIVADEVFAELGHPAKASQSMTLLSYERDAVEDGRITVVGPDLDRIEQGAKLDYAQVMILAIKEGAMPDPFDLERTQYLTDRLPGYMVRAMPGRLWVRIGKQGKRNGLDLATIGAALIAAYRLDFEEVVAAETILVTSSAEDVRRLEPIALEAEILAGQHKKLVLGIDGDIECSALDCEVCDEKPVCDNLRDVVIKRREKRNGKNG
jgi:CO dehydrogenase/acetyl-CoA synthase beta subunit